MHKPIVSIALASYNGARFIGQQLESILQQSYPPSEIIIVDDCSTDATIQIIQEFQQHYTQIKLSQNSKNLGVCQSFARALSQCSGDYIALSDQDDVWFPNKLETLLSHIGDALLIYSDAVLVDQALRPLATSNVRKTHKITAEKTFFEHLMSTSVTGCTALISKRLRDLAVPIPANFYIHDHYLAIIASYYGQIKFVDLPLVYYRQHGGNSIGASRPNYVQFKHLCRDVGNSYASLLSREPFKNNSSIEILRDYRLSIAAGQWQSRFALIKLLKYPHGFKLLIFYWLSSGISCQALSEKLYNLIHRINSK